MMSSGRSLEPGSAATGVRPVKSAERTVALLEYLGASAQARSLREVTEDLGIPRASAYALLRTLVHSGWVELDGSASRFRLGIRALRAGASYIEHDDVVRLVQPVMNAMSDELGETVHLARLDGHEVVYLGSCIAHHSLAVVSRPGQRMPCWATALGKAILATRPWPEVDALLPPVLPARTAHTITDREALRAELVRTARRGHAVDRQESTIGLKCFAVPLGVGPERSEALSCSVPTVRLDADRERTIVAALKRTRDDAGAWP